jgi:HlyD family secretion protein
VTLQNPPQNLRPGLSATAKITTASRNDVLSVPIQALTVRREADLKVNDKGTVRAAAPQQGADKPADNDEIQGVFVVRNKKVEFQRVQTGVAGVTDIEVLSGIKPGEEVVTGSYKILRTIKPGTSVKVDNSAPKREDQSS